MNRNGFTVMKQVQGLQIFAENGSLVTTEPIQGQSKSKYYITKGSVAVRCRQLDPPVKDECLSLQPQVYSRSHSTTSLKKKRSGPHRLNPIHAKDQIFGFIETWQREVLGSAEAYSVPSARPTITIQPKSVTSTAVEADLFNSPMYRKKIALSPRPISPAVHAGARKLVEAFEVTLQHIGLDDKSAILAKEHAVDMKLAVNVSKLGLTDAARQRLFAMDDVSVGSASVPGESGEVISTKRVRKDSRLSYKAAALLDQYVQTTRSNTADAPQTTAGPSAVDIYPSLLSMSLSETNGSIANINSIDEIPAPPSPMSDSSKVSSRHAHVRKEAIDKKAAGLLVGSGLESDSDSKASASSYRSIGYSEPRDLDLNSLSGAGIYVPQSQSPEFLRSSYPQGQQQLIGPAIRAASADRRTKVQLVRNKTAKLAASAGMLVGRQKVSIPIVGPVDEHLSDTNRKSRNLYRAPSPPKIFLAHEYHHEEWDMQCKHCFKVATLLCESCRGAFCYSCWPLVPHHQIDDIVKLMQGSECEGSDESVLHAPDSQQLQQASFITGPDPVVSPPLALAPSSYLSIAVVSTKDRSPVTSLHPSRASSPLQDGSSSVADMQASDLVLSGREDIFLVERAAQISVPSISKDDRNRTLESSIFVDDRGRVIPKLEKPSKSLKSAVGFSGFVSLPTSHYPSSIIPANALTGKQNLADHWAELDLMRSSLCSEEMQSALSPFQRAEIREKEIARIGSVAVAAAERIRLAKKHNDIRIKDKLKAAEARKKRAEFRASISM